MSEYRKSQLTGYASHQQRRQSSVTASEISSFGRTYSYYLKGWFPRDKQARIVDIGCGAGLLLAYLKDRGYTQLSGVDASPSQVDFAREVAQDISEADALQFLSTQNECYELIIALDFFEHLTKDEALQFLADAFAALSPGGRIVLQTPNGESPWVGNVLYGDLTHENCYTPHLLEKLLTSAGFRNIEYRPCGPTPTGIIGIARTLIWAGITLTCRILNKIEGAVTAGIYSRVFMISGTKPS